MYEDLIAKMDDIDVAISNGFGSAKVFLACVKITRLAIETHKPFDNGQQYCKVCIGQSYPCETIQAIAKELE